MVGNIQLLFGNILLYMNALVGNIQFNSTLLYGKSFQQLVTETLVHICHHFYNDKCFQLELIFSSRLVVVLQNLFYWIKKIYQLSVPI